MMSSRIAAILFAMGTLPGLPGGPLPAADEPWSAKAPGSEAAAVPFRAGFAESDISPEIGMEEPGGYVKSYHRKFHDPCKARAAVFDDGKKRVALVGVDGCFVPAGLVQAARKGIQEACGIPPEAVLIAASHSHSSGPLGMVQPGEFDHAPASVRSLAYEKTSLADAGYLQRVEREIVAAVSRASGSLAEALCGAGRGTEDRVSFNRRLRMKGGRTFTHPGQGNPDILGYAGPIDPDVGAIGAWSKDGKLLGCVVHFACHATTSPGGISANYIYSLEQTIRGAFGSDAVVVFLQGAAGDVTQVDNLSPSANPPAEDWCRFVGGRIGAEAVKVLLSMARGPLGPVDARQVVLKIPRRAPRPERVRRSLEIAGKGPEAAGHTEWAFAKEIVLLDALLAKSPVADVEIQAVQVGPAVFLGNPAELFCKLGLEIKSKSPFPLTFPVTFANAAVGYVPAEEAFAEDGGGYETRLTSYSNLEIGAGRKIVEASVDLARKLVPGKIPARPGAPPFGGPWTYGNVPAEKD